MAADIAPLAEGIIAALTRRRASGVVVSAAGAARAAVEKADEWGVIRALVAADPVLEELGVSDALGADGREVLRWPEGAVTAGGSSSGWRARS